MRQCRFVGQRPHGSDPPRSLKIQKYKRGDGEVWGSGTLAADTNNYLEVVERSISLPGTIRRTPPAEPLDDIID